MEGDLPYSLSPSLSRRCSFPLPHSLFPLPYQLEPPLPNDECAKTRNAWERLDRQRRRLQQIPILEGRLEPPALRRPVLRAQSRDGLELQLSLGSHEEIGTEI